MDEEIKLTKEEAEIIRKLRSLKKYGVEGIKSYNYLLGFIPGAVDSLIASAIEESKIIDLSERRRR